MVWKTIFPATAGDSTQFAGLDLNKISNLFNGNADVDAVDINSNWTFRDRKLKLRNPTNTFAYTIHTSSQLDSDREIGFPNITGDDTFVLESATQTLTNKTIDGTLNNLIHIDDASIDIHTSTKITVAAKEQLHTAIAYSDQSNTFGAYPQRFLTQSLTLSNPSQTADYIINTSGILESRNITIPLLYADDNFVFQNNFAEIQNKTVNLASNVMTDITSTAGDLVKHNGLSFRAFPRGAALQVLRTNPTGDDLEWITPSDVYEKLMNKSIDAELNTIEHVRLYPSAGRKFGDWIGTNTSPGSGLLSSLIPAANQTTASTFDLAYGKAINFQTQALSGSRCGMMGTQTFTMRGWFPRLKAKIRLGQASTGNQIRMWLGFTSITGSEPTGDDYLNSASGYLIGFKSTDLSNFTVAHNDGTPSSPTIYDDTGVVADGEVHTLEIIGDNANSQWGWSIDGVPPTYTSLTVPGQSTPLTAIFMLESNSNNVRNWDVFYVEVDQTM